MKTRILIWIFWAFSSSLLAQSLKLTSTAFKHEGFIPEKYSCKGADISPPLHWENVPKGTKSFVLIAEDPDAPMGTWIHWVVFNIPADYLRLPENIKKTRKPENLQILQGLNSWGKYGYGGPCPPSGTHRYFFKIYALDSKLSETFKTKKEILKAMQGHILQEAVLMGKFSH